MPVKGHFEKEVGVIPFHIPDVGVLYLVGYINIYEIALDDNGDEFDGRVESLTNDMVACYSQEEVIAWLKNNEIGNVKFFCEFGREFYNKKEEWLDFEYILVFDYTKILEYLHQSTEEEV